MNNIKKVALVLLKNKNKFLFYLRDDYSNIVYPNHWSLLGGGVEKKETLLQALKREIIEEINYDLKKIDLIGSFKDIYGSKVYVYKSNINKKVSELRLNEGQKLKYFNSNQLVNLKMPPVLKNFLYKHNILN